VLTIIPPIWFTKNKILSFPAESSQASKILHNINLCILIIIKKKRIYAYFFLSVKISKPLTNKTKSSNSFKSSIFYIWSKTSILFLSIRKLCSTANLIIRIGDVMVNVGRTPRRVW
jgi:hypothetical protein